MLAFVLGIKAVGKSRVIQELNKHLGNKINEVSYGDAMLGIAREVEGITDREEIARLAPEKQKEIREKAARKIRGAAENEKLVFLNTHGFVYTVPHHTYLPGSPDSVSDLLKPDFVLLVEASAEAIRQRRESDLGKGRKREVGSLQEIEAALLLEKIASVHLSARYSVELKVFDNTKPIAEAEGEVRSLAELFKSM